MNFLIDAHLPRRLAHRLRELGHDAVHTLDLPNGNRTTDREINALSHKESRVVVTKDADFVNSMLIHRTPHKLILVSCGNISNNSLEELLHPHLSTLVGLLEDSSFIELTRTSVIVHV